MEKQRIQKLMSLFGVCSRKKAEELIKKKQVYCNNKLVKLGDKASRNDVLKIGEKNICLNQKVEKKYYVLNKPKGVLTTLKDDFNRKTILSLIKKFNIKQRVYPVGRLDLNSQGMLILTNDGEFSNFLMHPKNQIEKTYKVTIEKELKAIHVNKLKDGVLVNGFKTAKAKVELIFKSSKKSIFLITICEGKKRQIRNMVKKVVGCQIKKLERIAIGGLKLKNVAVGQIKQLSLKEVELLKNKSTNL